MPFPILAASIGLPKRRGDPCGIASKEFESLRGPSGTPHCHIPASRKAHLILDNYIIRKSRQTLKWIERFGPRMALHFLPPYSPDHNVIERLWKQMHDHVTRNHRHTTMNSPMEAIHEFLEAVQPFPGTEISIDVHPGNGAVKRAGGRIPFITRGRERIKVPSKEIVLESIGLDSEFIEMGTATKKHVLRRPGDESLVSPDSDFCRRKRSELRLCRSFWKSEDGKVKRRNWTKDEVEM